MIGRLHNEMSSHLAGDFQTAFHTGSGCRVVGLRIVFLAGFQTAFR